MNVFVDEVARQAGLLVAAAIWAPELVHLRARLRTELTGSPVVAHPEREHRSERMVLIVDELASNGQRHGGPPVAAMLSRSGDHWMITFTDSPAGQPPQPAQGWASPRSVETSPLRSGDDEVVSEVR